MIELELSFLSLTRPAMCKLGTYFMYLGNKTHRQKELFFTKTRVLISCLTIELRVLVVRRELQNQRCKNLHIFTIAWRVVRMKIIFPCTLYVRSCKLRSRTYVDFGTRSVVTRNSVIGSRKL
jgi:hypothetical protein